MSGRQKGIWIDAFSGPNRLTLSFTGARVMAWVESFSGSM